MIVTVAKARTVFPIRRWPLQRGGEDQEGCWEASGGRDSAGIPARLSRGGVCRQPPVPRPWRLPAEIRQLVFTLALQECVLQSLLHQISLDTDAGGAKECVCSCKCVYACVCVCLWERGSAVWAVLNENHQRATKRSESWKYGRRKNLYWMCVKMQEAVHERPPRFPPPDFGRRMCSTIVCAHQLTWLRSLRHQALGLCSHAAFPPSALFSSSSSSPAHPFLPTALCLSTRVEHMSSFLSDAQTFWCRSDSWQHCVGEGWCWNIKNTQVLTSLVILFFRTTTVATYSP